MKEKVFEIFANVFEMPLNAVQETLNKSNFNKWDSIMHLTLISDLEMILDISFEPEEIENITSIETLLTTVEKKSSGFK